MRSLLARVRRVLRTLVRRARPGRGLGGPACGLAAGGHVGVIDVTEVPRRSARGLARRLTAEAASAGPHRPRQVILAPPATAAVFRRAGLRVELASTAQDRDAALVRFGTGRTVHVLPVGAGRPVVVAPVHMTVPPSPVDGELPDAPIFVGGTGRSGTWALGRLLGEHPALVTVHSELRFHAQKRAFSRMLKGTLSPGVYADEFLERYFGLVTGDGNPKGIQLLVSRWEATEALTAFRLRAEQDLPAALGGLVRDLVDPYARGRRAGGWVETTPSNAAAADALTSVLPRAHVIHTVRDGRDVAVSMAAMPWGPDDPVAALGRWAKGLRASDAAFRVADPDRVHVVRFEDLTVRDRDRTLAGLLDRLGIQDRTCIEGRFAAKLDPTRAHIGRWRQQVGADAAAAIDARYRSLLGELADEGVGCLPVPPHELEGDVTVAR